MQSVIQEEIRRKPAFANREVIVSSSEMNNGPLSVWKTIARIVGFGITGSIALALAGFLEGLIAFSTFTIAHQAIYPVWSLPD